MRERLSRLIEDAKGATAVEYGLVVALIVIGLMVAKAGPLFRAMQVKIDAVNGVLGGVTPITFLGVGNMLSHLRAGTMTALVFDSEKRSPSLPDTPAIAEAYPGFVVTTAATVKRSVDASRTVKHTPSHAILSPSVISG